MIAICTGDVVNSSQVASTIWLPQLKEVLSRYGSQPIDWEVYRGDSFQFKVPVETALEATFLIKATLKKHKGLDVRVSIGLGGITYQGSSITESNGTAFQRSGRGFDALKKETIKIVSPFEQFDAVINLILEVSQLTFDAWSPNSAALVATALKHPELNQMAIAKILHKKSQGTVSEGLQRAGYEQLQKILYYYSTEITTLCSPFL